MTNEQLGPSFAMDADPVAAAALASRHAAEDARLICNSLNDSQRLAVVLASKGIPAKSAARLCGINIHTVYTHRCRALQKMGVNSIAEAAVLAAKAGLV